MLSFKAFIEATDIFGFDKNADEPEIVNDKDHDKPVHQFNLELMMWHLLRKNVGLYEAECPFENEIIWGGHRPGAIKLESDTGFTFFIKRLGRDMEGNERWATKKVLQLNRRGIGGWEEQIAGEIHDHIVNYTHLPVDGPMKEYDGLENLVYKMATKIRKVAPTMFLFQGIKKLDENVYHIVFGLRSNGVQAPNQQAVEQVVTQVSYDEHCGTIKVDNYKISSKVGRDVGFRLRPKDFEAFFFPTQPVDEITEAISVHMRYY